MNTTAPKYNLLLTTHLMFWYVRIAIYIRLYRLYPVLSTVNNNNNVKTA